MNILVAGGAGFIGSNFIRYILKKYHGYKIINLDKGNPDNLRDIEKDSRYGFARGDICDEKIVNDLASRRPDAIINFAREFIKTDILGTQILLEAAKKYQISYLQISTGKVYGSVFAGENILKPDSPYSASKAGADLIVQAYHKAFDLPVLITRCSNNYGPYQYPKKLIPLFITNLLEGGKIPIYGDGLQTRNWTYVLDHCSAIDCVLHHGKIGEVYNIGANAEKTNLEVAKLILNLLDKDETFIEYIKDGPSNRRCSAESTKLRQLGWRPKYMFDEAMSDTIDWYINNPQWWKNVI